MRIERFTGGPTLTHGYLVWDPTTREALAVDAPQGTARALFRQAEAAGLNLLALVLTHGHFDHVLDVPEFDRRGVPVWAHPGDVPLLQYPQPALFGLPMTMPTVRLARELGEGDRLTVGACDWQVLRTPGHSPGSIALYAPAPGVLISGDVLFAGGMGRTDLPFADEPTLFRTLARLLALPGETRVLPGHGPETTLAGEAIWLRDRLATAP